MKILLGTLKDKGEELASFLEPRVGVKGDVSGGELELEDKSLRSGINSRQVKTYVKRFLSIEKVRKDYRVLVDSGELRLVELEAEEAEEEEEKPGKNKTKQKKEEVEEQQQEGKSEGDEEKAPDEKESSKAEKA